MTLEQILAVIGAIVPLASAIASALNQHVRTSEAPSVNVLKAAAVVNTLALNLDKTKQAIAAVKGLGKK